MSMDPKTPRDILDEFAVGDGDLKRKLLGNQTPWFASKWSVEEMYSKTRLAPEDVMEIVLNSYDFARNRTMLKSDRMVLGLSFVFDEVQERLLYTIFTAHRDTPQYEYDSFMGRLRGRVYV